MFVEASQWAQDDVAERLWSGWFGLASRCPSDQDPLKLPLRSPEHRFQMKMIVAFWRHHIGPAGSARTSIVGEDLLPHSQFLAPSSTQLNTIDLSHPQSSGTSFEHTTSISVTGQLRLDEAFEDGN
ncbi:hypothetical protein BLNAU_11996 [Blattamonas nauphoetae]|uniref:Uncharacterized protein n=1 Tax=Blattamonas nauphoetae TaxID=2049346 RepID=A0ABQ9XQR1_9EUKA|nr:hypothetical protein BLNAU_11996 [Blattamonas nauphoetae]